MSESDATPWTPSVPEPREPTQPVPVPAQLPPPPSPYPPGAGDSGAGWQGAGSQGAGWQGGGWQGGGPGGGSGAGWPGGPGWDGYGGPPPERPTPPPISPMRRLAIVLATLALVAIPAFVGYRLGNRSTTDSGTGSLGTTAQQAPNSGSNGSSGVAIDAQSIASKVSKSVVNITSQLSGGGEAAGTGILISASGLVLTNNHVIADSESLSVEIGGDGSSHAAKVLGYSVADDVALVQIQDASGLAPALTANSSALSLGDPVVALGNAGGRGGAPTVVSGSVVALGQQITASDRDGTNAETLSNLIETDANIQPGDSGGPLVDANGRVVGMNAAASATNGGFGFRGVSETRGYAIPIESALAIGRKISSGDGSTTIHIGGNRALLGVAVQPDTAGRLGGSSQQGGAPVTGVQKGSGADKAGIVAGDTITAVDGKSVSSTTALTKAMVAYNPKDTVQLTWVDANGATHHASVTLGSGPPA